MAESVEREIGRLLEAVDWLKGEVKKLESLFLSNDYVKRPEHNTLVGLVNGLVVSGGRGEVERGWIGKIVPYLLTAGMGFLLRHLMWK